MHIPLVYEHLFYKYFVRRSVGQATKGKRASLLLNIVIHVFSLLYPLSMNKNIFMFIKVGSLNIYLSDMTTDTLLRIFSEDDYV